MMAGTDAPRHAALLVTEQIDVGGKRSHVDILQAGLTDLGWDAPIVDWAALSWPERAFAAAPFRALNWFSPGAGYPWLHPLMTRRMGAAIARALRGPAAPELVHVQEVLTYRAARRAAGGRPVVLTVHGPLAPELAMVSGIALDHPAVERLRGIEREAYRGADAVISVDRPHAAYVCSFGRADPATVIENFVDTRRFSPAIAPRPFPPEIEAWIGKRPVVFCPRRLVPKNGVATAVRAAAELEARGTPVAVVVAGDGPQRAELERLAKSLPTSRTLRFLGEVAQERIPGWYRRASVAVVPSSPVKGVEEATSISALEAQAVGLPVVASAIGGLPEIVEDGVTGRLIAPDDPAALARAIEELLADPSAAAALGARAAAAVELHHSHRDGARKYVRVYETVLARRA